MLRPARLGELAHGKRVLVGQPHQDRSARRIAQHRKDPVQALLAIGTTW